MWVSFGVDENVLKLIAVMAAKLCKYTKTHWIVHFKELNCIVCKSYLNKAIIKTKNRQGTEDFVMLIVLIEHNRTKSDIWQKM